MPGDPEVCRPVATYSGISIGRAKRISTCGSSVRVISLRSLTSGRWSPLFSMRSMIGAAIRPLFGIASRTMSEKEGGSLFFFRTLPFFCFGISEGVKLTGDNLLCDTGDICKVLVHDALNLAVEVL